MTHITFYRYSLSGHSHRVELFLSLLGLNADIIDINLNSGDHTSIERYNRNTLGQTPVLKDGPNTIADSNAILVYLASKYDPRRQWLPLDAEIAADVQRYISLAVGQISYKPTTKSALSLTILEPHLLEKNWLSTTHTTIAYIAHAPEEGVSLETYPALRAWIKRIKNLPGFIPVNTTGIEPP